MDGRAINKGHEFPEVPLIKGDKSLDSEEFYVPVIGNSMMPMLVERDILLVSVSNLDKISCGDIVIRWDNELIAHRVLSIDQGRVYTKGDARFWMDAVLGVNDIVGKALIIIRNEQSEPLCSFRWRIANRVIGYLGWLQVKCAWRAQTSGLKFKKSGSLLHRFIFWVNQKLNKIIFVLLVRNWLCR